MSTMKEKNKSQKTIFTLKNDRFVPSLVIIGILIVILISFMTNTRVIFTAFVAFISACASYEMVHVVGGKSKLLIGISTLVSVFTVFAVSYDLTLPSAGILYGIYSLLMLSLPVFCYKNIKYIDMIMGLFSSIAAPQAFSCLIRLNDAAQINPDYKHYEGVYFVGLCFVCSWLTDTFAYIVGSKLGKHKMCPEISPKKSVEGAIGGILIAALFAPLLLFIFNLIGVYCMDYVIFGESNMKYLYVVPITAALSAFSMVGDLSASVLKRNLGIKDYSKLIPGHGGIMDRFDSCTFVFPGLYIIVYLISTI